MSHTGRVRVDVERLRRWRVSGDGLAGAVSSLLGCRGRCRELARARLWGLGLALIKGQTYNVYLVRGLSWRDSSEVLRLDDILRNWGSCLVFSLTEPPLSQAQQHMLVALPQTLSLTGSSIALDHQYLEAAVSTRRVHHRLQHHVSNSSDYIFQRRGEYWTIAFEGPLFSLRHLQGLAHIAYLLARPNTPVPVSELYNLGLQHTRQSGHSVIDEGALKEAGLSATDLGDAGALLDEQAKREYRQHIADLEADIRDAEDNNDWERVARLKEEKELFIEQLSAAIGLGGRDRKAASVPNRMRVAIRQSIERALKRIEGEDPKLALFLHNSFQTGNICTYKPDREVSWLL